MTKRVSEIRLSEKEVGLGGVDWEEVWEKHRKRIVLGFVGLFLFSFGLLAFLIFQEKEPEIEIFPVEEDSETLKETIFVDLEGAVQKPGVYQLPAGSRVNDVLIRAGGLAATADREWVAKNLNLAQKLVDGIKIYIPARGEGGKAAGESSNMVGRIDINTAPASQLDTLWGIGPKRAADIIANRPYQSTEELVERKIVPGNVYERIKDEITVF